jgi:aminopeptidase N
MSSVVPANIDGPRTEIDQVVGQPAPDLVFPNYGDHAYAKIALDEHSVEWVRTGLDRVEDDLLRNLLWSSLWEMVRDTQIKSTDYLGICRAKLPDEKDLDIVVVALERVAMTLARYIPDAMRLDEAHQWFEIALAAVAGSSDGDTRVAWARSAIRAAMNPDDVARLIRIVDGGEDLGGFEFDQEMRWSITVRAIAFGLPDGDRLLADQSRLDPSDRGRRAALQAEAARPTPESKELAWQRMNGEGYGSFHLTRAAMMGFLWAHQDELLAPYVDRFFGDLRGIFEDRDHPFARAYIMALYPAYRADRDILERSRQLLAELDGNLPTLSRQLTEHADELDRQIRVREFAEHG